MQYDEALRLGYDEATRAGLSYLASIFPFILPPAIITALVLVGLGLMGQKVFVTYGIRIAVVMWLVVGGAYVPIIRDALVDDIPAEISRRINNSVDTRMGAVQQFAMIDAAAGNYVAQVNQVATGITQIGNKIAAWFARGMQKIFLEFVFYIWIGMRQLAYLVAAAGSFMILFFVFESTRGWAMSQLGRMVGVAAWQVSASILLKIMLGGTQIYLKRIQTIGTSMSIDMQIDQCLDIAGWFFGMLVLFFMVPASVAIGTGAAASSAVATGMFAAAGTNIVRAGNNIAAAAKNMRNASKRN